MLQQITQFGPLKQTDCVILTNGNVGINRSSPTYLFDVNGTFGLSGIASFNNSTASTSSTTGALVCNGG